MSAVDKLRVVTEIDVEQGLKTVAGNEMIYLKLLAKLEPLIDKTVSALNSDAIEANMQVVSFEAHSIKGAMYNLGVTSIGDSSKELEQMAKDGNRVKVIELLPGFLAQLGGFKQKLVSALKS